MYQKKEKFFCKKLIILSKNNLQILKLATYTKIEDHYSRCKLATFYIRKDCQMFIFYFVYPKHQVLLIGNENKEIYVANLMIQ